ncbi:hypothetical protein DNTS_014869 [Danionella cerebrum]|uniref:C2H2-type domain-containing protein n=1 Tax=Danionella cerebrum TaxID=2873325 RepID=A0A553RCB0_9TELE|nr:hypothetical protein DNTS_014869 [Danionella translucida]
MTSVLSQPRPRTTQMQTQGHDERVCMHGEDPDADFSSDAKIHQTNLSFPHSSRLDLHHRSPESVEMDEIMAAMVLTSLSCSPVVQSPPQKDLLPGEMECCGGDLSDSGSSGYWSWDRGSVRDRSPGPLADEGLLMELEPAEPEGQRSKSLSRGTYSCLWPACGKLLTSRVGMKRHIRFLHLGRGGSEQSHREEDFYYTEVSSDDEETGPSSPTPSFSSSVWSSCSSTQSQNTPGHQETPGSSNLLSQSAPSSVWQIHTEHLYQSWSPVQVTVAPGSPSICSWAPAAEVQQKSQVPASRSRSVSVGEQWLEKNSASTRSHAVSASPSRGHCSFRKGRGEAKKCRKVYGVERRDQWCTACRWKKACQRFPD